MLRAADIVVSAIKEHKGDKPFVLGLSTGRTPLGLYNELVKRYNAGEVSFAMSRCTALTSSIPWHPTHP